MSIAVRGTCKTAFVNWLIGKDILPPSLDALNCETKVQFGDKYVPGAWIWRGESTLGPGGRVTLCDMKEKVDAMVTGVELRPADLVIVQLPVNRWFSAGTVIAIEPPGMDVSLVNWAAVVCISTMTVPYDFTGMAADDERVVRILANPDFSGYSNAEEFITMQHVKNKLGHPLMLGKKQRASEDIATWLERTEAAIRHTLRNGTVVSGKDSVDSGGVRGDGVGGKN